MGKQSLDLGNSIGDTPVWGSDAPGKNGLETEFASRGVRFFHLRDGLVLHTNDGQESGASTPGVCVPDGLICTLVLQGEMEGTFGGNVIPMRAARRGAPVGACGLLVSLAEPVDFSRRARPGSRTRKVNVTVNADWLERAGLMDEAHSFAVSRFARTHLGIHQWRASPRAVAIAEELLRPAPDCADLASLYRECRAIELLTHSIASLAEAPSLVAGRERYLRDRSRDVEDYLRANLQEPLDLSTIATALAMSPSSLQRTCRAAFGTSVFDLLRKLRMDTAHDQLRKSGVTVAEAAHAAGYSNAANFATAFKRAYGIPPSEARRRVIGQR